MPAYKVTIRYKDEPTQRPNTYFMNGNSKSEIIKIVRKINEGDFSVSCIEGQIKDNMFYPNPIWRKSYRK